MVVEAGAERGRKLDQVVGASERRQTVSGLCGHFEFGDGTGNLGSNRSNPCPVLNYEQVCNTTMLSV